MTRKSEGWDRSLTVDGGDGKRRKDSEENSVIVNVNDSKLNLNRGVGTAVALRSVNAVIISN